jgi:uncharacterized membrane protein
LWSIPLGNLQVVGECGQRALARDRESAAKVLREAYAAGRLSVDEFGERIDAVYSVVACGELDELTADLPEGLALPSRTFGRCSHQALEVSEPRRPFAPIWGTVAIWLVIAALAHVFAAIPLVLLSLWVVTVTRRTQRRHHRDDAQQQDSTAPDAPEDGPSPTAL